MSSDEITLFNIKCKQNRYLKCHGLWSGLVFPWYCESKCQQEKNQAIDKVVEPASIATATSTSEGFQRR